MVLPSRTMSDATPRQLRAGDRLDDHCRACKVLRGHTVMAAGSVGAPVRVVCDYCGSQHNYRGGERARPTAASPAAAPERAPRPSRAEPGGGQAGAGPLVSERERRYQVMSDESAPRGSVDFEMLLRRVLREEMGLGPAAPADKWRGGDLVLRPGRPGLQEKSWPIEAFFHKVVMLRNRLRVLEQQVNASGLPADEKVKLQSYVTACYGTLTSFNVLFAEDEDRFKGSGGGDD
jgi:hypothetical protein